MRGGRLHPGGAQLRRDARAAGQWQVRETVPELRGLVARLHHAHLVAVSLFGQLQLLHRQLRRVHVVAGKFLRCPEENSRSRNDDVNVVYFLRLCVRWT